MKARRGFTLLEVLVATVLMAIAVTGLLGALRVSLSNAARVTETERAAALARRQMDELLALRVLPKATPLQGLFPSDIAGGVPAGWSAVVMPFESGASPGAIPSVGSRMLERIQLEVWWQSPSGRRTLAVEAYRGAQVEATDLPLFQSAPAQGGFQVVQ